VPGRPILHRPPAMHCLARHDVAGQAVHVVSGFVTAADPRREGAVLG
jgi:hypothetical protein